MSELGDLEKVLQNSQYLARQEALAEAEKTVRDMAHSMRWASDIRLLKIAADRIGALK